MLHSILHSSHQEGVSFRPEVSVAPGRCVARGGDAWEDSKKLTETPQFEGIYSILQYTKYNPNMVNMLEELHFIHP